MPEKVKPAMSPDGQNSGSKENEKTKGASPPAEPSLATLSDEDIKAMTGKKLTALCKLEELKQKGTNDDKIKRLFLKKYGRSDKYVNLMTKCRICNHRVLVTGTDKKKLDDERLLITRSVKCTGRHRHTYPLKEIIKADELR